MSGILIDWLGSGGKPVSQFLAESRSKVCLECPEHVEPKWWERVKSPIADEIKKLLGIKHHENLKVESEESLSMCKVCGCCCRLKIWVPLEHIKSRTSVSQVTQYPPMCWIRKEMTS